MKFYSKLILFCFLGLVACHQEEPLPKKDIQFKVDVSSPSPSEISLCITHTGSNRDTYYGILTQDNITDKTQYVNHYLDSVGRNTIANKVWNQRKRVEKYRGIVPFIPYHFLVFALDSATNIIHEPTCVDIETTSDIHFEPNANWQIDWKGETKYKNSYWTCVNCLVIDDSKSEPFYACLISEEQFKKCNGIDRCIYWLLNEAMRGMENNDDWYNNNMISRVSTNSYFQRDPGNYYAFMIGVNQDGSPTGQYCISDPQPIAEYTMLDGYKALIGKWTLLDATGIKHSITIKKNVINKSVSISGWMGRIWPVIVQYDPNAAENVPSFTIHAQRVAEQIEVTSSQKTFLADIYLWGWYVGTDNHVYRTIEVTKFANVEYLSDDCYVIDKAYYYSDDGISTYGLSFYIRDLSDNLITGRLNNSTYTYPITLTRKK